MRPPTADAAGMLPIPREALPSMLNKPIHLSWARPGARWILRRIDGDVMHLETERTRRASTAHVTDARYVRRFEPREKADA